MSFVNKFSLKYLFKQYCKNIMSVGISNLEIKKVIENSGHDDLKKKFVTAFAF